MSPRKPISKKRRVEIFTSQKGLCWVCDCKLMPGQWDVDHRQALIHGGDDLEDNLRCVCDGCHKVKTSQDVKANAKVKRIAKGGKVIRHPMKKSQFKRKWPKRPFGG